MKDEEGRRITREMFKFPGCHTAGFRHDAIGNGEKGEAVKERLLKFKSGNAGTYLLHLRKFSEGNVKTQ